MVRTERRDDPVRGPYPWLASSTAMVNHYSVYLVDEDFGPLFIKVLLVLPVQRQAVHQRPRVPPRQLAKEGIAFEALDNGVLSCADPARMRRIAAGRDAAKIDALLRNAGAPAAPVHGGRPPGRHPLRRLRPAGGVRPHPGPRPARPRTGLLRAGMRENLDLGRPDHVQLIFDRRVTKRTPSRFRTRVITDGVIPSLHVDYKHSRIKQYRKEGRALRTETVVNDTYDFDVGRRLTESR